MGLSSHRRTLSRPRRSDPVPLAPTDPRPVDRLTTSGTATHAATRAAVMCVVLACCWQATARGDEPPSLAQRVAGRDFPSVFQAWNPADNLAGEPKRTTLARHDLVFHAPDFYGLRWIGKHHGLATGFTDASLAAGRAMRADLLSRNPNMVLLAEVRYRDAHASHLPADHQWWLRQEGKIVPGWEEGGYFRLDVANPAFRAQVARQAKAVVESGVCDGIMLDWWDDDDDRLALVREIRAAIGDAPLILANANHRRTPRTAEFLNGYFLECYQTESAEDWKTIADTLRWAESQLRPPRVNCLETWHHGSRQDLRRMRATTTMALTLSDGYCLFSDPNPLPAPDHLHDWYPFWNEPLGRPLGQGARHADGSVRREFDGGLVVYNPPGNGPVEIEVDAPSTSAATRAVGRRFRIEDGDGDLLLLSAE